MQNLAHTFLDARILVIDDTLENVNLIAHLLEHVGYINVELLTDSSRAMHTIQAFSPDVILLDLHMPQPDGYEILKMMRESGLADKFIPVLVFTADARSEARNRALEAGASDFLTKPGDAAEILLRVRNFLHARKLHVELQRSNQFLEDRVWARTADLSLARREALEALARAAELQDDETGPHTMRVGQLSARIAEAMGEATYFVEAIRLAAPLHDIGNIGMPAESLADLDKDAVALHTLAGERILARATSPLLVMARNIAKYHHEHWDGSGVPNGLAGGSIPLEARIVAVADTYDELTSGARHRPLMSHDDAVSAIGSQKGLQFDPKVVDAFARLDKAEPLNKAA